MSDSVESTPVKHVRKLSGGWILNLAVSIVILFILIALLLPPVEQGRGDARASQCKNNIKLIMLALHNYHDGYGSFPPAYVADAEGKPKHSWRVLILPYMDQKSLYEQYDFSEPWDGPNNSGLHDVHLSIYTCPSAEQEQRQHTSYVAVVGTDTMWPGAESCSINEIVDGASRTICVVETVDSGIHWMEPRDITFEDAVLGINVPGSHGIASEHKHGANVGLADGASRFLATDVSPELLRSLLLINDGGPTGDF